MASLNEKSPKAVHYNDWPNSQGFDVTYEERTPVELQVTGRIPAYTAGVLFRTGLGPRKIETAKQTTFKVNHWFDSLSQVHRFQIHPPEVRNGPVKVTYNSRIVCDGLISKIKSNGKREAFTFGAKYDPCVSFFQKLQSVFLPRTTTAADELTVSVTLSPNFPGLSKKGGKFEQGHDKGTLSTLCNKTDASVFQMLDPETLEPIGVTNQTTLHPLLKGPMSAAHARSDPVSGDVYNYNLDFGRSATYRVFTVSAATGKTSILATIQHTPAYLHSFFLTENYLILCVWNSYFKAGGAAILWKNNIADALAELDPSKTATWFIIDKKPVEHGGRGVVAKYTSDAFFSFHTVNAYEEPSTSPDGGTDIVADVVAYESLDCVKRFYIDNILSDSPTAKAYCDPSNTSSRANLRRFRLPHVSERTSKEIARAISEHTSDKSVTPELPTLNGAYATKKHRYIYGIVDSGKSTFSDSLVKYDVSNHSTKIWSIHGHTAGEPIFVANPEAEEEDGGVLLSVVLDGIEGRSYLLCLDAKTMEEVGRAHVNGVVGFGFHGTHVLNSRL